MESDSLFQFTPSVNWWLDIPTFIQLSWNLIKPWWSSMKSAAWSLWSRQNFHWMLCPRAQLGVFWDVICGLVMINKVWNSKEDEGCLSETWYYGFGLCRVMCNFDLYLEYLWGKRFPESLPQRGNLRKGSVLLQLVQPHYLQCPIGVRVCIWAYCCTGSSVLRWLPAI